jgi:hypothetical protein
MKLFFLLVFINVYILILSHSDLFGLIQIRASETRPVPSKNFRLYGSKLVKIVISG